MWQCWPGNGNAPVAANSPPPPPIPHLPVKTEQDLKLEILELQLKQLKEQKQVDSDAFAQQLRRLEDRYDEEKFHLEEELREEIPDEIFAPTLKFESIPNNSRALRASEASLRKFRALHASEASALRLCGIWCERNQRGRGDRGYGARSRRAR